MAGIYNNGLIKVTVVDGSKWVGLYAADGSLNIVEDDTTYKGLYHPCGALRVSTAIGTGAYAPDGSLYLDGPVLNPRGKHPRWLVDQFGALAPYVTAVIDDKNGRYGYRLGGPGTQFVQCLESQLTQQTRSGTRWYKNAQGVYTSAADNTTLILPGLGAVSLPAITNKCTNYNANPPALIPMGSLTAFNAAVVNMVGGGGDANTLWGVVDDSAALTAAGLATIVAGGRVYKIDNTAGAITANLVFGGQTGNTNPHTMAAYLRGTAGIYIRDNNNNGQVGPFGTLAYARYASVGYTPLSTVRQMEVSVAAGYVGYIILNSLVETATDTDSPIVVAGASATVTSEKRQLLNQANTAASNAKAAVAQVGKILGPLSQPGRVWATDVGNAEAPIAIGNNPNTTIRGQSWNGSVNLSTGNTADLSNGYAKIAVRGDGTGRGLIMTGGSIITDASPLLHDGNSYIASDTANRVINGMFASIAFLDLLPTDAQMAALVA